MVEFPSRSSQADNAGAAGMDVPEDGKLVDNVVHFARALRKAGLPVGPGHVLKAVQAVELAGFSDREDFYWTLHACFVSKPAHLAVFRQTFRLFWRDPRFLEHMMSMLLPLVRGVQEEREATPGERRAAEALVGDSTGVTQRQTQDQTEEVELEIVSAGTASHRERLRMMDFEQMSAAEMAEARRMIAGLRLPVRPLAARRSRPDLRGRIPDWRGTMRSAAANGGELRDFRRRKRQVRWPDLVALCDISGSMSSYTRPLLHFLHAIASARDGSWDRLHAFTFGTRLTDITRQLRRSDVDAALESVASEVPDWDGGTRIGECIRAFNVNWSRRVMGRGSVVFLITDGLESGCLDLLAAEMERLQLSARRLIWINPLLRWESFAPKAGGVRTMMPHVDCFRPAHNVASLSDLANAVSMAHDDGEKNRMLALMNG